MSYETQAKVLSIRLLVSWLAGLQSDFEHFASPVFRLLDMLLAHDGDLQGDDNIRSGVAVCEVVEIHTGPCISICRAVHTIARDCDWPHRAGC